MNTLLVIITRLARVLVYFGCFWISKVLFKYGSNTCYHDLKETLYLADLHTINTIVYEQSILFTFHHAAKSNMECTE